MKCYKCGLEASTAVKSHAMVSSKEITRFYCASCFNDKLWKKD